jgi:hypothetical protein
VVHADLTVSAFFVMSTTMAGGSVGQTISQAPQPTQPSNTTG